MGRTIAQTLIEEGKELGKELGVVQTKREDLTKLLRGKFGESAQSIMEKVKAIQDANQLDALFDRALVSKTLEEPEI